MLRGNIRVVCRARPSPEASVLEFPQLGSITVSPPDRAIKDFEFNACFGPESSQVGRLLLKDQIPYTLFYASCQTLPHVSSMYPYLSTVSCTLWVRPCASSGTALLDKALTKCHFQERILMSLCRKMCGSMWHP